MREFDTEPSGADRCTHRIIVCNSCGTSNRILIGAGAPQKRYCKNCNEVIANIP